MTAIREQILAAIEARFRDIESVQEVSREAEGDPDAFDAIHFYDDGQQPLDDEETGSTRYGMGLVVDAFSEGGPTALNALYVAIIGSLMTEPPLDGLAETISEGALRPHRAPLAAERGRGFSLDFTITFPTRRGRPDLA